LARDSPHPEEPSAEGGHRQRGFDRLDEALNDPVAMDVSQATPRFRPRTSAAIYSWSLPARRPTRSTSTCPPASACSSCRTNGARMWRSPRAPALRSS
jgi:hypothetical protein